MAVCSGNDISNTEMEPAAKNIISVLLSDFINQHSLPQCVCVSEGSFLSRHVQISCGDVLLLKSCDSGQVTLSYRKDNQCMWTNVNVSYLDYPGKFQVLLPKDISADDRALSIIMYPTIADLLLDCPTYFEATASYDDPYFPGMSIKSGDRFWFIGAVKSSKDGLTRLKVRDHLDNIIILTSDCRGNFCPLKDDNVYTIKELIDQAPVQRRLIMLNNILSGNSEEKNQDGQELSKIEYMTVNTIISQPDRPISLGSSLSSNVNIDPACPDSLDSLPLTGIIHMLKPESLIDVSPYNDLGTTWAIPVSANLKVRTYCEDDYEIPATRRQLSQSCVPMPLSPDYELPKFPAPSVPPSHQPLVPIQISNFVDIYCSSFPVKAKILNTSGAHPFFQNILKNVEEVTVCRLDKMKRLYVKDTKSETVYSLSHDLKLSFIEYPEKFRTISELVHLPNGSEVTVLEDISADFPKPFSLRFGDIIRLKSNTPYLVKTPLPHRDCKVIKCERIDPEGKENTKLKLPLDFEVNMVITTNPNSRRLISLQDLLSGAVPIPVQKVASIPEDAENQDLSELPVDLEILMSMSETCVVLAPSSSPPTFIFQSDDSSSNETSALLCSNNEPVLFSNVGLPLTSGIVLAFRDRLDLFKLDLQASEADYIRLPVGKMTMAEFEDLRQRLKVNPDYEDMESGSSITIDECGTDRKRITRASSNGFLEKKPKSTKMDKVRRLSRALNPKHWHYSKSEPEPLPHPSTMDLASLGARSKDSTTNEYQEDKLDSMSVNSGSTKSGSRVMDVSIASDEVEDENFYEDVEICHLKSSSVITDTSRWTGAFSGPTHKSLPIPHTSQNKCARYAQTKTLSKPDSLTQHAIANEEMVNLSTTRTNGSSGGGGETHANDIPKPFTRAKNWATTLGNNLGGRLGLRPREDGAKSSKMTHDCTDVRDEVHTINSTFTATHRDLRPPDSKPPLPPQETIKLQAPDEKKYARSPPIPQTRQRNIKPSESISSTQTGQNGNEDSELAHPQIILKSIHLNDSIASSKIGMELPKPKPRGLKSHQSLEKDNSIPSSPQPISRQGLVMSGDFVKGADTLSVYSNSSSGSSNTSIFINAKDKYGPKPPPKPRITTHTTV